MVIILGKVALSSEFVDEIQSVSRTFIQKFIVLQRGYHHAKSYSNGSC